MMQPDVLKRQLCNAFCGSINVRPVPSGLAISSAFEDQSGDPISFYLSETDDGFRMEDDGFYLAHLIAKDVPIEQGQRGQLLDAILGQAHAYWDRETLEIRSESFPESEISQRVADFLSSLIRVRDLELLTREVVRSTFREDAMAAIMARFGNVANIDRDVPIDRTFADFPADLVITPNEAAPREAQAAAVYLVTTSDRLNEALLLHAEAQLLKRSDFEIIAMIEEPDMKAISRKKFQRAQNRSLPMPIFRGDEDAAMNMIGRRLRLVAGS